MRKLGFFSLEKRRLMKDQVSVFNYQKGVMVKMKVDFSQKCTVKREAAAREIQASCKQRIFCQKSSQVLEWVPREVAEYPALGTTSKLEQARPWTILPYFEISPSLRGLS